MLVAYLCFILLKRVRAIFLWHYLASKPFKSQFFYVFSALFSEHLPCMFRLINLFYLRITQRNYLDFRLHLHYYT